jgi:ATP-dependent protease ClpP protease subunit
MMANNTHKAELSKVSTYSTACTYQIFLDENIDDAAYYRAVIDALSSASRSDTVEFHINNGGGLMDTAAAITHAMDKCTAKLHGVITGTCASAATSIALHCDTWEVGATVSWMVHTASFGVGGSAPDVRAEHAHNQALVESWLSKEYEGFYTEDEIATIAEGKDSWLDRGQLVARLNALKDYRVAKEAKRIEDQALAKVEADLDSLSNLLCGLDLDEDTFLAVEAALARGSDNPVKNKVTKKKTVKKTVKDSK